MDSTHRTTMLLRPYDMEQLEDIKRLQGGIDATEAMRRALQLTAELMREQAAGNKLELRTADGKREVLRFI